MAAHPEGDADIIRRYMVCRLIGHTWQILPRTSDAYRSAYGLWDLVLECPSCTTQRRDAFDSRGQVTVRSYSHPDDYSTNEQVYRPEVRRIWMADNARARRTA